VIIASQMSLAEARGRAIECAGKGTVTEEWLMIQPSAYVGKVWVIYFAHLESSNYPGSSDIFQAEVAPGRMQEDTAHKMAEIFTVKLRREREEKDPYVR
jgi:hypothetical protein